MRDDLLAEGWLTSESWDEWSAFARVPAISVAEHERRMVASTNEFRRLMEEEQQIVVAHAVEQERSKWARLERMEKFMLNTFPERGATILDLLEQIDTATERERQRCLAIVTTTPYEPRKKAPVTSLRHHMITLIESGDQP